MISQKNISTDQNWIRINNRNVSHLLGVEFMHNLYNRHLPRINSIRFRNTITIWKSGQVNSYAPADEWRRLNFWLGEKFYNLDKELLQEINKLLKIDRSLINRLIKKITKLKVQALSDIELGIKLIDLQELTLGEIYKINVVQIEYPLNSSLLKLLEPIEKNFAKRSKLLSEIIVPDESTESQTEQIAFSKIVAEGKKKSIEDPKKDKVFKKQIISHYNKYAYMHCAYGEQPMALDAYFKKYEKEYRVNNQGDILAGVRHKYQNSLKILESLNNQKITLLAKLMAAIGVFRDKNKAFLGQTVKYRFIILDEIARRDLESRKNLDYYLLLEISNLLETKQKLDEKIIKKRKRGVTLVRNEFLELGSKNISIGVSSQSTKILEGICASKGKVSGICKIIITKDDAFKIKPGEIMVAIGTDFDLLEAMHLSAGIITEEGGLLSHASVVSREIGKPCCIGVKNATSILKDGVKIVLDATVGKITFQ